MASQVSEEILSAVSKLADLDLSAERLAALTPQMQGYMALFGMLDALDYSDLEPVTVFSAEWR